MTRPRTHPHLLLTALALLPVLGWPVPGPSAAADDTAAYYVNRNSNDGDHEVHRETCRYLPAERNRIYLGDFSDCHGALEAAHRHYRTADGCYHCARACDTG